MIPKYRQAFNHDYSTEKYKDLIQKIQSKSGMELKFKIAETPIFLPISFRAKLEDVCHSIIEQIKKIPDAQLQKAVPTIHRVPNDSSNPHFLILDFGICKDENGEIVPELIELQAFPSLFGFMQNQKESYLETFPFLNELEPTLSRESYIQKLKNVIVGDEKPENVILLEIFPDKQKTNIDFKITEDFLGIKTVCVTKIKKIGKKLFYENEGNLIPIHKIYNRVIFDELDTYQNLKLDFDFKDDLEVKWITHPNWFYKISKFLLPQLQHQFIPKSYYLNEFPETEVLENYVLKPLFSFAGKGVNLHPTQEEIHQILDKNNFIMQKKVKYEALFEDVNGEFANAEIRMMFIWDETFENPEFLTNLVRMTKSESANMGVMDANQIWVGCSYAFFG